MLSYSLFMLPIHMPETFLHLFSNTGMQIYNIFRGSYTVVVKSIMDIRYDTAEYLHMFLYVRMHLPAVKSGNNVELGILLVFSVTM